MFAVRDVERGETVATLDDSNSMRKKTRHMTDAERKIFFSLDDVYSRVPHEQNGDNVAGYFNDAAGSRRAATVSWTVQSDGVITFTTLQSITRGREVYIDYGVNYERRWLPECAFQVGDVVQYTSEDPADAGWLGRIVRRGDKSADDVNPSQYRWEVQGRDGQHDSYEFDELEVVCEARFSDERHELQQQAIIKLLGDDWEAFSAPGVAQEVLPGYGLDLRRPISFVSLQDRGCIPLLLQEEHMLTPLIEGPRSGMGYVGDKNVQLTDKQTNKRFAAGLANLDNPSPSTCPPSARLFVSDMALKEGTPQRTQLAALSNQLFGEQGEITLQVLGAERQRDGTVRRWEELSPCRQGSGCGAVGTQCSIKAGVAVTPLHDEIGNSSAVDVMSSDGDAVALWIAIRLHDCFELCQKSTICGWMKQHDLSCLLRELLEMQQRAARVDQKFDMFYAWQFPGDVVYSPSGIGCDGVVP